VEDPQAERLEKVGELLSLGLNANELRTVGDRVKDLIAPVAIAFSTQRPQQATCIEASAFVHYASSPVT
jgi:hypothetical protein